MKKLVHNVYCDQDSWLLFIEQLPMNRWLFQRLIERAMDAVGHPCCGHGVGRIGAVRRAATRAVTAAEHYSHDETHTLIVVQLSSGQAATLAPGLVKLLDEDDTDDIRPADCHRGLRSWRDIDTGAEDVNRDVVATWMAHALDDDMSELVAKAVAGDQWETHQVLWAFDTWSWAAVGVHTAAEASLWMSEGCATAAAVQKAKDAGLVTSWALRVVRERTARGLAGDEDVSS